MRQVLRAGLFGLGVMGRNHARLLRSIDGVELAGVCDPTGDAVGVAGGAPVFVNAAQLIERSLDFAVVAAPTDDHTELGIQLADAGVAALIEKPLARDLKAGIRIAEAFDRAGVIAAVGHVERCNAAVGSMRTRIANGDLGEVYQVATSRQGPFPGRIRDVGVVKDLATHDLDLVEWVTGRAFETLSARVAHRAGRQHEDLVVITGMLEEGVVATSQVNWLSPTKDRRVTVLGERGCFVADTLTADLTFFSNGVVQSEWDAISKFRGVAEGDMIRYALAKPEPLRVELEAFRDAVLGGGEPVMTLAEGLRVLAVADAVSESASANGTTTAPEPVER